MLYNSRWQYCIVSKYVEGFKVIYCEEKGYIKIQYKERY